MTCSRKHGGARFFALALVGILIILVPIILVIQALIARSATRNAVSRRVVEAGLVLRRNIDDKVDLT